MSATGQTKIFGMRIGLDPKILIGVLIVLAGLLFWYNSRGDDTGSSASPVASKAETTAAIAETSAPSSATATATRKRNSRRVTRLSDNGILKLKAIDPTRGDVDPTLHLDLLVRVQQVQSAGTTRNLFDIGPSPAEAAALAKPIVGPVIPPKPLPPGGPGINAALPTQPGIEIPFKFYGFMKPSERGETNRGLFLDGDNILVASEGELLKQRYLVVELTPNSARMEDTRLKQKQTLAVVPEARVEAN